MFRRIVVALGIFHARGLVGPRCRGFVLRLQRREDPLHRRGPGEPVVLIHGFTANIQGQWGMPGIISKLNKDYQVMALDNRGHGKSDKPHDPKQYGPKWSTTCCG